MSAVELEINGTSYSHGILSASLSVSADQPSRVVLVLSPAVILTDLASMNDPQDAAIDAALNGMTEEYRQSIYESLHWKFGCRIYP